MPQMIDREALEAGVVRMIETYKRMSREAGSTGVHCRISAATVAPFLRALADEIDSEREGVEVLTGVGQALAVLAANACHSFEAREAASVLILDSFADALRQSIFDQGELLHNEHVPVPRVDGGRA